jgi:hypothetical protein
MGIASGTLRKSSTGHSKSLAETLLSVVVIGAVCILFGTLCLGQEETRS